MNDGFHILQPNRDPKSNWEVDIANTLDEYILKICSGEISSEHSVNFAEAALLLQGSVQVYSRKVEYLHSLVLHVLEFLSQKRQDRQEKPSTEHDGTESNAVVDKENETFLGLDDVPVEANNCLDDRLNNKDDSSNKFLKLPANLLVLEGDCLDTSGDGGELESYLLSTCEFYGDFLLLDPCDAGAISDFVKTNAAVAPQRCSSVRSKAHHDAFRSPTERSGGSAQRSGLEKNQSVDPSQMPENNCAFHSNNYSPSCGTHVDYGYFKDNTDHFDEPNVGRSNLGDDSDEDIDDPWNPLNPHGPGNLKIKPFKKGKIFGRQVVHNPKRNILTSQFPIAKLDSFVSPEFAESFELLLRMQEKMSSFESPPLYEWLRRSLTLGVQETYDGFGDPHDENDDNGGEDDIPDFDHPEFDQGPCMYKMDTDIQLHSEKGISDAGNCDGCKNLSQDNLDSDAILEDLCRSHLDALLPSIAEPERQTELAARVSSWKQRIEQTLEEQESHPPFDVHLYGERILNRLTLKEGIEETMSFTDLAKGQSKYDVTRTFSALLQLVNNGNVDIQRAQRSSGELVVHTGENPFRVRLLRRQKRREEDEMCSPRKKGRTKPSTPKVTSLTMKSSQKCHVEVRHVSIISLTPEGKRRRRYRLAKPVDPPPPPPPPPPAVSL